MAITSLFIFLLANYFIYVVRPATFTIQNNCTYTVWPGILTIEGDANSTGMTVDPLGSSGFSTTGPWKGRVWGRFDCLKNSQGKIVCDSGDCGSGQIPCNGEGPTPPVTLGEWTVPLSQPDRIDTYGVSLVDGFNLPMMITPLSGNFCNSTSCPININERCPERFADKDKRGKTIGCKSACVAFNKPKYCCDSPPFSKPETCNPTDYSKFFKNLCPQASSYAYDVSGNITCGGETDYIITFCPSVKL